MVKDKNILVVIKDLLFFFFYIINFIGLYLSFLVVLYLCLYSESYYLVIFGKEISVSFLFLSLSISVLLIALKELAFKNFESKILKGLLGGLYIGLNSYTCLIFLKIYYLEKYWLSEISLKFGIKLHRIYSFDEKLNFLTKLIKERDIDVAIFNNNYSDLYEICRKSKNGSEIRLNFEDYYSNVQLQIQEIESFKERIITFLVDYKYYLFFIMMIILAILSFSFLYYLFCNANIADMKKDVEVVRDLHDRVSKMETNISTQVKGVEDVSELKETVTKLNQEFKSLLEKYNILNKDYQNITSLIQKVEVDTNLLKNSKIRRLETKVTNLVSICSELDKSIDRNSNAIRTVYERQANKNLELGNSINDLNARFNQTEIYVNRMNQFLSEVMHKIGL